MLEWLLLTIDNFCYFCYNIYIYIHIYILVPFFSPPITQINCVIIYIMKNCTKCYKPLKNSTCNAGAILLFTLAVVNPLHYSSIIFTKNVFRKTFMEDNFWLNDSYSIEERHLLIRRIIVIRVNRLI